MSHSIKTAASRQVLTFGILAAALVTAAPGWAAGPSQADFAQALRPVPTALRGGYQGLPTLDTPVRAASSRAYRAVAAMRSVGGIAGWTATQPRPRPVAEQRLSQMTGCPATAADNDGKPMIGFKVAFEFGSAQLKPEAIETLRNLGKALNEDLRDQKRFEIEGHTDAVGSLQYNEQLSQARAEAVKEFLVRDMGVAPARLEAIGKSYCEPVNPHQPYAAENRRVVVLNQSS